MKNKIRKNAFTLIELLVVATIIGLLATIAFVSYSQLNKQSRDAKRKADLEQIRAAVEMYRSNDTDGEYPSVTVDCNGGNINPYLSSIPTDPKCVTYTYYYSATTTDYTVGAFLEGSTSTCSVVISCGISNCNYCMGPYGKK